MYCGEKISDEIPMVPPAVAVEKKKTRTTLSEIAFALGLIISILLSALLLVEVYTMLAKSGIVVDGISSSSYSYPIFIITPYMIDLFRLSGTSLIIYYVILIIAVLASVILLYAKSIRPYLDIGKDKGESAKNSALYEMTVLFAVMMAIEIVYLKIVGANSSPIDQNEVWKNMFSLLSASVWEEVISRLLLIGVPIAVIYMIKNRDVKEIKKAVGGFNSFNVIVIALILISSAIFALAHVVSGAWEMWKVFPTFLFGVIAGYLFVKYGLHVVIAMHFLNDYLSSESWLIGSTAEPLTNMILIFTCIIAIPFIYIYGKKIVLYFKNGIDEI